MTTTTNNRRAFGSLHFDTTRREYLLMRHVRWATRATEARNRGWNSIARSYAKLARRNLNRAMAQE